MPYDFTEYPHEPGLQPASSRGGRPPIKRIGTDVLDGPEDLPPNLTGGLPHISFWWGIVLLVGSLLAILLIELASR